MIRIEHLRVRLPARFRDAAEDFPRYLGAALAKIGVLGRHGSSPEVEPGRLRIAANADLRTVAEAVAREIAHAWQRGEP